MKTRVLHGASASSDDRREATRLRSLASAALRDFLRATEEDAVACRFPRHPEAADGATQGQESDADARLRLALLVAAGRMRH